jgi:hypothetical protein
MLPRDSPLVFRYKEVTQTKEAAVAKETSLVLDKLVELQAMTEEECKRKYKTNSKTVSRILKALLLEELQAEVADEEPEETEDEAPAKAPRERKPRKAQAEGEGL